MVVTAKRGISVLDLMSPAPGSQAILPAQMRSLFEAYSVVDHYATTSDRKDTSRSRSRSANFAIATRLDLSRVFFNNA